MGQRKVKIYSKKLFFFCDVDGVHMDTEEQIKCFSKEDYLKDDIYGEITVYKPSPKYLLWLKMIGANVEHTDQSDYSVAETLEQLGGAF